MDVAMAKKSVFAEIADPSKLPRPKPTFTRDYSLLAG